MKYTLRAKKKAAVIVTLAMITFPAVARSGWVDDWLTSKQSTGPSSFDGATRGYYNGGSFQAHWKNSNDYLMTISKPHMKSGCGGIDIDVGGFGFLDVDYLVKKLQRIMSAAPAAAFDLALKAVSEQVAGTLKDLGSWADKLNQLQLDDCKASKALVATIASPASGLMSDKMQSEIKTAQTDFWQSSGAGDFYTKVSGLFDSEQKSVATGAAMTAPTIQQTSNGSISGCPQDIKDIYADGSILDNLGAKKSLDSTYIALIRGFIGDVEIITPTETGSTFLARTVPGCDENASAVSFITGGVQSKNTPRSACSPIGDTNSSLINYATNSLNSITGKMKSKTAYTADDQNFLASLPSGTYMYLRSAVSSKMEQATVQELANITANAFAYYMLTDLFNKVDQMLSTLSHINGTATGAANGADPATCQYSLLNPTRAQLEEFKARLQQKLADIKGNYDNVLVESSTLYTMQARIQTINEQIYEELRGRFTKGIADHLAKR